MAGRGVGTSGGACHRAYWQSVSKATGMKGGFFCPGTEKHLREIRSRLFLGSSANKRFVGVVAAAKGVNSKLDRVAAGLKGTNLKRNFIYLFWWGSGDAPTLLNGHLNSSCAPGEVMVRGRRMK